MKTIATGITLVAAMCATVLAPATAALAKGASKVKVVNSSNWTIERLYLSAIDEAAWGPDQLGDDVIKPGADFTLSDIPCDRWDVKLVDEDGDECIVEDVDLCKSKEVWEITSKDLLRCQAASE